MFAVTEDYKIYWHSVADALIDPSDKHFSTNKAAEQYILMNKPCLSVNDVVGLIFSDYTNIGNYKSQLIKQAKKKLS